MEDPCNEVFRLLGIWVEHKEAYDAALLSGDKSVIADLERKMAQVYMETSPHLLSLALANISMFVRLGFGLIGMRNLDPVEIRIQDETIDLFLKSLQTLLPLGYELSSAKLIEKEGGENA